VATVSATQPSSHPSQSLLAVWLETGRPSSVDEHLETCEECAARLDELTDLGGLHDELAVVTSPPGDLNDRTTVGVKGRLAAQEAVSVVVEMLTIPFRTAAVLIGGDEREAGIDAATTSTDETQHDDGERHDG
jgi:hypothetical protein